MDKREVIAKILWMDGGDSDVGYNTSHQFVKKVGKNYDIADKILEALEKEEPKCTCGQTSSVECPIHRPRSF